MKKNLILITLGFGTLSCTKESSKSENEIPDSSATISIAHDSKSDLGNTIWVNARYLETLEQTKSPLKAKIYADTVMVSFNTTADTANMVWNFHEGSAFRVKKGDRLELFNIYEEKPTPEYSGNVDESTLKLENTSFKKVNTVGFIEKKFWIGKYNSNGKTIELRSDNQLLGMEGYETYRVWADYITTQTNIDLIDFGKKDSDKTKTYGYKFAGDEIIFYDFIWEDDGIMGKAGKEVFRWKKQ